MRLQDRLLRSLSHQDLHYRAFVARQVERLVIHFDSEDLLSTVRASWHEAPGPMAPHFLCAYNDLFPRHLRAAFSPGRSPVHSQLTSAGGRLGVGASRALSEGRSAISRSATHLLEPCIQALRKRAAASTGRERRVLLATLARFHHSAVEAFLGDTLADDSAGPLAAFLLAACFGVLDDAKLIERLQTCWGKESLPQYMLALRYLPTEASFAFLSRSAKHKSPAVQWLTAMCLDRHGQFDLAPLVQDLFAGQFGWTVAHALETLGRLGRREMGLRFVKEAIERFDHPLVRTSALRSLVSLAGPDGIELCLRELRSPSSNQAQAQAISSLIQLGAPPEVRAKELTPLVKSPSLEVASAAILGLIGADNTRAGRAMRDLVVEGGEDERVQAAYCLGYYPGDSSVRVLEHLVRTDPSPAVRLQALRAFSYYERSPIVTGRLISFLDLEEERLVIDALRILASPGGEREADAAAGVAALARYGVSGPLRRLASRSLGRFENPQARSYLEELLVSRNADPDALLGAVEGSEWCVAPPSSFDGLKALLAHELPAVRATAARALFGWGHFDGLPVLAELASGTGSEAREAVKALEEIATIIDYMLPEPRFLALAEQLRANMRAPGYLEFSRRELGLVAAPADPGEAVDPHAPVLSAATWQKGELGGQTAGHLLADIEEAQRKFIPGRAARRQRSLTQDAPAVPGPEDRLAAGRPRKPWLVAAGGVLLGAVVFGGVVVVRRPSAEEPHSAATGAQSATAASAIAQSMVVASVRGLGQVEKSPAATPEPLATEVQIDAGQRVLAAKGSAVRLGLSPPGNGLTLLGEGAFRFDGLTVESAERRAVLLRISGLTGRLSFDLKWGRPRVELDAGSFRVKGWKGLYAVQLDKAGGAVLVASGRVEVTDSQGDFTLVTEGQKFVFKPGMLRGEVQTFEPSQESWK